MFRAGKEKRNLKPQSREDRDAGKAWGALPEGMGKSTAELHPLQPWPGWEIHLNFHRNRSSYSHVGCAAKHTVPGKKIPQKHLKYLH